MGGMDYMGGMSWVRAGAVRETPVIEAVLAGRYWSS